MWGESKQASSSKTALAYLTIGALTVVWTVIYYLKLNRSGTEANDSAYLWTYGFFFTGLVLIGIGLLVGSIGRSAMRAEVAPTPEVAIVSPAIPRVAATPSAGAGAVAPQVPAGSTVPRAPVRATQAV